MLNVIELINHTHFYRSGRDTQFFFFRIISAIPSGTQIGIITFDTEAKINLEPTEITELNRAGIHGKIPGRVGKGGKPCLACAMKSASEMVKNGGKVIVVTSEEGETDITAKSVLDLPLYTIAYSGSKLGSLGSSAEQVYILDTKDGVEEVEETFYSILQREELLQSRLRFYALTSRTEPNQRASGKFVVEESLRDELHVVASSNLKEDIESFELVSPSGRQFQFPVVEKGILHFQFPGAAEPGVWSYSYKTSASAAAVDVTVSAAAEHKDQQTAELEVWTAGDNPPVVYARVRFGALPVSNASVTANIRTPGDENLELVLEESGAGYPDITPGDGIYSAYFTQLSSQPGFYSISVRAWDGAGRATVVGETANASAVPTPSFTRYARSSFHLSQGAEYLIVDGAPQMDDMFPPARITDLSVSAYLSQGLGATLSWTAPGGDYGSGKALSYELRCYTSREALSDANFSVTAIPVAAELVPAPEPAGTQQTVNITLPWSNEIFYYGLVAVDGAGHRGQVSNLVPVFVDEVSNSSSSSDNISNSSLQSAPIFRHTDDNVIYIVSGSLTGLALIALCLGIAFICRTKRKEVLDGSDSLDYIKERGPATLLPATKYSYPTYQGRTLSSDTGTYSQETETYSTKTETYSARTETYSPVEGSYPVENCLYSNENHPYFQESQSYPAEPQSYSQESQPYPPEAYSPPRTSPSEYSTDSVFLTSRSQNSRYQTYQNLPGSRVEHSESDASEASLDSRRREWELRRQNPTWSSQTCSGTWDERSRSKDDRSVGPEGRDRKKRRESFV